MFPLKSKLILGIAAVLFGLDALSSFAAWFSLLPIVGAGSYPATAFALDVFFTFLPILGLFICLSHMKLLSKSHFADTDPFS